jgi:hypothetical protein
MEPYRSYYPHAGLLLETTEEVAAKVLLLPNGTAVGEEEIAEICSVIRIAVERSEEASAILAAINNPEAAEAELVAEAH